MENPLLVELEKLMGGRLPEGYRRFLLQHPSGISYGDFWFYALQENDH